MKYSDVNNNGILDHQENWFLAVRLLVFIWSLFFLSWSYMGNEKPDRMFLSATLTASAASFGMNRLNKRKRESNVNFSATEQK